MNVLMVSAEAAPFAKVGGLADVVGSLPAALRQEGVEARVVMPGYGMIAHEKYDITPLFSYEFSHRQGTSTVRAYTCERDGVRFYFLQGFPYVGEEASVYTTWEWDAPRFIWFNQAVMAFIWQLHDRTGWRPNVVNVHDWHTALLPFLIADARWMREWQGIGTVLTIHNIAYQGSHVSQYTFEAGINPRYHPQVQYHGLGDNLLGIGVGYADMVNTVSPRYAEEIQYPYAGYELAGIIRDRKDDLMGILNGLDMDLWNPQTDKLIAHRYDVTTAPEVRKLNKRHLQASLQLPVRDDVPLLGMVTRLASQKGFDLAIPALRRLMVDTDVQFVVLGTGEPELEWEVRKLASDFGWRARAVLSYNATVAQQIYASCDMFLMPSHFEPCGMGQMIAMRYGALPVVRETGGLADTVVNYDNGAGDVGTGFVFQWETSDALLGTLRWAIETYRHRPQAWRKMQERAMQTDFSWHKSAQAYVHLYERALQKHNPS